MDENEITRRLRDAGRQELPGDVRSDHLTRMHAAAPAVEKQKRFGRLAVAAAAFVGFAVGSTGFAMAGALPAPAQQVAHDVLSVVQVDVEDPKANRGQCVSAIAKDPDRTPEEKKAAKDAECPKGKPDRAGKGKPDHADKGKGRPDGAGPPLGRPNDDPNDCKGRPPWAGKKLDAAAKEAAKAEFAARCGRERDADDDGEVEVEIEEDEAPEAGETETPDPQGRGDGLEQAPPIDPGNDQQGQGRAPEETPAGPPAEGAPGQQDEPATPPVEVPDQPTQETPAG